jgi:hypothetical protein
MSVTSAGMEVTPRGWGFTALTGSAPGRTVTVGPIWGGGDSAAGQGAGVTGTPQMGGVISGRPGSRGHVNCGAVSRTSAAAQCKQGLVDLTVYEQSYHGGAKPVAHRYTPGFTRQLCFALTDVSSLDRDRVDGGL